MLLRLQTELFERVSAVPSVVFSLKHDSLRFVGPWLTFATGLALNVLGGNLYDLVKLLELLPGQE